MADRKRIRGENPKLRAQVEKINKIYFAGKLKIDTVGFFSEIDYSTIAQAQFSGYYVDGKGGQGIMEVGVNPIFMKLPNIDLTETLIHELIHIWQYQYGHIDRDCEGHGKWFKAKAMQIMKANPKVMIKRYATQHETHIINTLQELRKGYGGRQYGR